jgi:hypothetical protein
MTWIITISVFVGIGVLTGLYVAGARAKKDIYISCFDFANFKDRELSKRGVLDRTKWWK